MNNTLLFMGELATASGISYAINTGIDASPLISVAITFGVSLITLVGGELIKFLVAYFKNKTKQLEEKNEAKDESDKKEEK